jgi:hypothetical protein
MIENYKLLVYLVFQIRKIRPAYKAGMTVEKTLLLFQKDEICYFLSVVATDLFILSG